ncbi:MAG: PAS domain S-box protein [Candidatus Buchananbacteria bacterium]|jgi:PAS domain S-box-containing protein
MDKQSKNLDSEMKLLRRRITVLEKLNAHYKDIESKYAEARIYAQNIVETVKQPLIIMDGDLRVLSANKSFYKNFKVNYKETEGRYIYDLGNGQWNISQLKKLLKEIITKKNVLDDYEIDHKFESIGRRIMLLNARRIPPTPAKARIILLSIEDITERKKSHREITAGLEKKVQARTKQLDAVNKQLQEKISDLEIFNKAAINRELKMIELEKENKELRKKLK